MCICLRGSVTICRVDMGCELQVRTGLYLIKMGNFKRLLRESAEELVLRLIDQVGGQTRIYSKRTVQYNARCANYWCAT